MCTGHNEDTTGPFFEREDSNWVAAFLEQPVSHKPGTHFIYNRGATFMLSAIVQEVTGMTMLDYLRRVSSNPWASGTPPGTPTRGAPMSAAEA